MTFDLTVVLIAHDETAVCGPTMRAADIAIETARARGYTVHGVIGLDAPTPDTFTYFHEPHFDHWERRVLQERDLGMARNALIERCDSRYVALLEAGDLISENWLAGGVSALDEAADSGNPAIAHPELNVIFDGEKQVLLNIAQESALFAPHYFYFRDYYGSPAMAPPEVHIAIPYAKGDDNGLSDPALQFTIETLAAGWRHIVVRDTIGFKRRRDLMPVTAVNSGKSIIRALPAMAVDRIRDLGRRAARPHQ